MIVHILLYRETVNPRFFSKHEISVLEHQENAVTSLVSFDTKSEYIDEKNEIN